MLIRRAGDSIPTEQARPDHNTCGSKYMLPLPPVIGWAAVAIAAVGITSLLIREWRRVNAMFDTGLVGAGGDLTRSAFPTLRRDPRTGIYRPD
jgi:hypothetical protein